tara:strand:+ start:27036 stop:28061 length:1026 start_codon:yes stop_codon:yes gene_type:complete
MHRFFGSRRTLLCVCALALVSSALGQQPTPKSETDLKNITNTAPLLAPAPAFGRVVFNEIMYNEMKSSKEPKSKAAKRGANVRRAQSRAESAASALVEQDDYATSQDRFRAPFFGAPSPAPSRSALFDDKSDTSLPLGGDWIELHNPGTIAIDLSGWTLRGSRSSSKPVDVNPADDDDAFLIPLNASATIEPKGYLVIARDVLKFSQRYPDVEVVEDEISSVPAINVIVGTLTNVSVPSNSSMPTTPTTPFVLNASFGFNLSAKGEMLSLYDQTGRLVDFVEYDDKKGWPRGADGQGYSLELIDPVKFDRNDPFSWTQSFEKGGSPGKLNDAARNARGDTD